LRYEFSIFRARVRFFLQIHTMHAWMRRHRSWATSRLRESIATFASLSIPTLITQIQSLSERLPVEGINRKRPISLFICLMTKTLHLELVSDYISPTFIAVYQWFVSRRGLLTFMNSNNGTPFHGADRELSNAHAKVIRDSNFRFATDGIVWYFLPPASFATLRRPVGGRR